MFDFSGAFSRAFPATVFEKRLHDTRYLMPLVLRSLKITEERGIVFSTTTLWNGTIRVKTTAVTAPDGYVSTLSQ